MPKKSPVKIRGRLTLFWETGMETGEIYCLGDLTEGRGKGQLYKGLAALELYCLTKGDILRIFNGKAGRKVVWEGRVRPDPKPGPTSSELLLPRKLSKFFNGHNYAEVILGKAARKELARQEKQKRKKEAKARHVSRHKSQ